MEPQKKPIHLNENDTPYLYEPFRNQMPAKRPHPAEKEKILKPWQGLLVFAFLMVLFNLAGIPLVLAGGMYGNALDEIIVFLIGSILVVRALHIPLKEVFPLKKPDGAGILGTILLSMDSERLAYSCGKIHSIRRKRASTPRYVTYHIRMVPRIPAPSGFFNGNTSFNGI